ncbi:DNA cytosine methyltransferase [Tropicimonas isoalkanivorans]|uniref:Cytosine-specific methyltransferase n=1 Tax=Tropicimonas isoalkanivorans TaxID=441112 RepID=A0A1I1JBX2_9RHOB|nr:DNA cytosine methyltransferase [Tropicimonas isoalkanivorans]SFC45492.1 DNA-methyltransferase (dcm) [Tropicimonas isoalkanivorans]
MFEPVRFLSVCSGIEAASVAWEPFGWRAVAVSEIDPFPCHVLSHRLGAGRPLHMPSPTAAGLSLKDSRTRANAIKGMTTVPEAGRIPNFGDMTAFREWPDAAIDLLVGGTPCQSFSVAGLRKGLDDPRGNLALVYLAIAARYRPEWLVWENVPGVLSSGRGRDFGAFLGALAKLGYGFAWRVLDAQYVRTCGLPFAVPQRRRRLFVVGYSGDWRPAGAVLFDGASLRGDPPPRRLAGKETPGLVGGGPDSGRISGTVSSKWAKGSGGPAGDECYNMVALAPSHHAGGGTRWAVRRLTPLECERLQGFSDGWTDVPYRGRNATPDGPRYKALGNSMAVNAMEWIGARIDHVRRELAELGA